MCLCFPVTDNALWWQAGFRHLDGGFIKWFYTGSLYKVTIVVQVIYIYSVNVSHTYIDVHNLNPVYCRCGRQKGTLP